MKKSDIKYLKKAWNVFCVDQRKSGSPIYQYNVLAEFNERLLEYIKAVEETGVKKKAGAK